MENDFDKLWLPKNSSVLVNKRWRAEHFPETTRTNIALITHRYNILTTEALLKVGISSCHYWGLLMARALAKKQNNDHRTKFLFPLFRF